MDMLPVVLGIANTSISLSMTGKYPSVLASPTAFSPLTTAGRYVMGVAPGGLLPGSKKAKKRPHLFTLTFNDLIR